MQPYSYHFVVYMPTKCRRGVTELLRLLGHRKNKQMYNRVAWPHEFYLGNKVHLLIPSTSCKFLAHWQSTYTIMYRLQQPGKHAETQVISCPCIETLDEPGPILLTSVSLSVSSLVEQAEKGPDLMPAQQLDLNELEQQFCDIFSTEPGWISVVQHHIWTPLPPAQGSSGTFFLCCDDWSNSVNPLLHLMARISRPKWQKCYGIESSRSPQAFWSKPIVVMSKPDGILCLCNDFLKLNEAP